MGLLQLTRQMQEADKTKDATIKALMKGRKLLDKQLKQATQVSDEATTALKKAVEHNKYLAGLVRLAHDDVQVERVSVECDGSLQGGDVAAGALAGACMC